MMMKSQHDMMEQQRKQQELLLQSLNNLQRPGSRNDDRVVNTSKKLKCPKWEGKEAFKSFIDRLSIWDKNEKGNGNYLDLVESLQSTGRHNEKEKIELEFMRQLLEIAPVAQQALSEIPTSFSAVI